MNDRTLFRYKPDYGVAEFKPALDWSAWPGGASGFQGAVEMCNNNGECRKLAGAVMCPSYRVTLDEQHVTRGRANTLRLAISGQLGPNALASDEMAETMQLCVSCKACRRECPTGVDMARMKIEVLAARNSSRGLSLHDRLVAYLPRYAGMASRFALLLNLRNVLPGAARLGEWIAGFSAKRPLPRWRRDVFRQDAPIGRADGREVALFADTFNTHFEPDNLRDAADVLARLGYRVTVPRADEGPKWHYASVLMMGNAKPRPLCCGRTFLAAGLVEEAKAEARRLVAALLPLAKRGVPILGLEPSCLFTLKDEMQAMGLGADAVLIGEQASLLETFLAEEAAAGRISGPIAKHDGTVLLHGHCHQKSFDAFGDVGKVLGLVDGLKVEIVESSCCGMAGAFGYRAETYETSMAMGELSLLPAVRKAAPSTAIVADGFSCRHQIHDGTGRPARHAVRILAEAMRAS
jgi:Fe-S oxidoreductase